MTKRLGAEFLGTAWLVFGGCGSAVSAVSPNASDTPTNPIPSPGKRWRADQREGQADGDRSEAGRGSPVGRAQDDDEEEERQRDLGNEAATSE